MADPIVRIYAEDEYAVVQVDLGYVGKFTFRYNAHTAWAAVLLTQRINQVISERMTEARADAYRDGWKNAKGKTLKQTWFPGRLP